MPVDEWNLLSVNHASARERIKIQRKETCGITWNKKDQPGSGRNEDAEGIAAED
jgi:hypothetical protein